jgi:hypothetical protein
MENREADGRITGRWVLERQMVRGVGAGVAWWCSVAGFGISGAERSGLAITVSVS